MPHQANAMNDEEPILFRCFWDRFKRQAFVHNTTPFSSTIELILTFFIRQAPTMRLDPFQVGNGHHYIFHTTDFHFSTRQSNA